MALKLIQGKQLNVNLTGSFTGSFSGSFNGTSSYATNALTASYLSGYVSPFPYTGSAVITGSLSITGSLKVTGGITGSLFGTASYADNSNSASYALSSSYSRTSTSASYAISSSYATNAGTSSNILGGRATHLPYFITDTTLATSSIYQSGSTSIIINQDNNTTANPEALYVWQPHPTSINVISGKGNLDNYLQLNINNTNQGEAASSDIVATANNGDETTNYIDMGINSENFSGPIGGANDAYLYSAGQHLHIGNITPNRPIQFFVGGADSNADRKFELNANGQHNMTGSLEIDESLTVLGGMTGSLYGTASWALNSRTASYALNANSSLTSISASHANNADYSLTSTSASHAVQADSALAANYAAIAGNGGVTSLIAGSGVTLLPPTGIGNVTIVTTGGGGTTIISGSNITSSFVSSNTWVFNHGLGIRTPTITVFDSNYNQIIPQNIELVSTSSATITFPTLESGFAVAMVGGVAGNAYSASYSLYSTYAATASYFVETDPIFVAKSASLATTGSNVFKGDQTITGSLTVSGSSTFTNIGPAVFIGSTTVTGSLNLSGSFNVIGNQTTIGNRVLTGSWNVSGSSTQIGNNTLIGNTVLSGSLNVSGSQTFRGSNELIGNTNVYGEFNVSGSSIFSNSLFTVTGSTFVKGATNISGSTNITGSLNVIGDVNVVSGSGFYRWGNKLFNYGVFSSTQTQTGSANTILSMSFNSTDVGGAGVSVVSGSRITVENTGVYNLQFSSQFDRTNSGTDTITVWFAYTGSSIANSATDVVLSGNSATNATVASWNYVLPMSASSYVQIYWSTPDVRVEMTAVGTRTGPVRPAVPSVIATLTQIA